MKQVSSICLAAFLLVFASCAHSSYPPPASEKETTAVHSANNIFN